MREILFRAWNRSKKIMVYKNEDSESNFWDGVNANDVEIVNYRFGAEDRRTYDWMQFTGMLDKNGTKIFEGDIIVNRLNRMVDKEPYQIIYDEYSGGWLWSNETGCDPFYQEIAKNGEVIGNIHDNPKLLLQ